jgi:type VI secretion system secreted protein Hcp
MAYDAFLNIKTIPGESTDDKHKDWIEILWFDHGVSQPTTGSRSSGGGAAGERANHRDFRVRKTLDKASPKLMLACCNGEHISEVVLELCRATGDKQKYMEFKLSDVIVSSVTPSGESKAPENLPLEEVAFNYGKIEWTYTATDHKTGKGAGDVKAHWDATANKGG